MCACVFQNVLCCPTPRLHCFLSSHWPSFRFHSFMAFPYNFHPVFLRSSSCFVLFRHPTKYQNFMTQLIFSTYVFFSHRNLKLPICWICDEHIGRNFHIRIVQHLDIIGVSFTHQLMHQWVVLRNNIKIYIKTAPTCFSVTVTPSSGSAWICAY